MEWIEAITKLFLSIAAAVGPPCAVIIGWWRRQDRKEGRPEALQDTPRAGLGPVLILIISGIALACLLGSGPQIARLLPAAESAELAEVSQCTSSSDCGTGCGCDRGRCSCAKPAEEVIASAPMIAGCTSASDCRSGCACTGGQCTPCSALEKKPKPQPPQKQKPRLLAWGGTICAGCEVLPQMVMPISQPF